MTAKKEAHKKIEKAIRRIYAEGLSEEFADVNIMDCILEEALQEQAKEIKEELMLDFANWDRECEFMKDIELIIRNNKYIKALTGEDKK